MGDAPDKALYVFSDAHLGGGEPDEERAKLEKIAKLFQLIRNDGDRLVILGDLFDFWFEYGFPIPKEHDQILGMLKELRESGVAIDYVCGNHDFWMQDYFPKQLHIPIHRDAFDLTRNGKRIHFIHGDGLAPADTGYRIMKWFFRNPVCIHAYSLLPHRFATNLAMRVSRTSRGHNPGKDYRFKPDYEAYAKGKLAEGYDVVMLGHLHLPVELREKDKVYINTGDFIEHFTYAKLKSGAIALEMLK